jgi:Tfp pilus assembly protein PilO
MSADPGRPLWRRRLLMPFLGLLGLNAALFGVFTLPRLVRERTVSGRAEALRAQVARQREALAALERRAETMLANQRDTEAFYGQVLGSSKARLVPLLREVNSTASELGLAAGSATYSPSELREAPLVRYQINMPLKGSYEQLVAFLGKIESSRHFLIVDQLSLREEGGEDAAGQAQLIMVLSTYFRAAEGGGSRGL